MASNSTTLSTGGGYANGFTLSISWGENSTSVTNNTSNISATATLSKNKAIFSVTGAGILRCYWHDNHDNNDRLIAEGWVEEVGYTVNDRSVGGTFNATHNGDGTLSGYAWAQWEQRSNYGGYPPVSGSVATGWVGLTTIPRASSIDSFTGTDIEGNFKVTYTAKSSSFTNKLRISIPQVIALQTNNYTSGTNFTLSASAKQEIYNRITSGNSITLGAVIETWNGNTKIGESSELTHTCYLHEPEPTFSNFTYRDVDSTTTTITGNNQIMISGKSSLEATITTANKATAKYNATMSKYTFQIAGLTGEEPYSASSSVVEVIGAPTVAANETPSATRDLVVTAIDSRGLSTPVTKTVTIVPYSSPVISATATRANGFENTTTVKISGSFSRIEVGGTAKNTVNASTGVRYRYRQQGSSTWGSWVNKTATIDTATGKVTVADFDLNLDNQSAFEFEFQITDKLETSTASLTVSVGQPAFYIGTDGRVSVGGMPTINKTTGEAGLLDIKGRAFSNGSKLMTEAEFLDKAYPIGSIYMTTTLTTATAVHNAIGGTWVAWGQGRFPVGMGGSGETTSYSVEQTGGREKSYHAMYRPPLNSGSAQNANDAYVRYTTARVNEYLQNNGSSALSLNMYVDSKGGFVAGDKDTRNGTEIGFWQYTAENRPPFIAVYFWKRTA